MKEHPTVIVTGSSGLVGSRLVSYFSKQGFRVRAFQRSAPVRPEEGVEYYSFNLADVQDRGFEGADILIHCAYRPVVSSRERISDKNTDIEAAKKIIALSRTYGIKITFLSTTSAHADSRSYYARTKYLMEGLFDMRVDLVLRLGLILGGTGGLFGKIQQSLKRHRVIPLIGGGRQRVQTLALDDLCQVIDAGIERGLSGLFRIAHPSSVTMREVYQGIAQSVGASPFFVSVPASLAYYGVRAAEVLGIRLPFTSQNILGLKDLRVVETTADVAAFGVTLRDCQTTLRQLHS